MTHAELVNLAAAWLAKSCSVIITEMSAGTETPDAIGWGARGSILVECKVSRADFLADAKKAFRQRGHLGMGTERYFLAPEGLLSPDEIPAKWGLLVATPKGIRVKVKPESQMASHRREVELLLSAMRRVGSAIPDGSGVSVKFYRISTRNTATLGIAPKEAS